MRQLFPPRAFVDFGPVLLDPAGATPNVQRILGSSTASLRSQLRLLCPKRAGVYGMIDQHGELLYVGKAKSLRTRLLSYFRVRGRPAKAGKIIRRTSAIAWESCPGEFAALLRELELIRRWRPRGNVQGQPLRFRHAFVCLGRRPAPYVFAAKAPPRSALAVHGPLPWNRLTVEAIRRVNELFRLRDCPEKQVLSFPDQAELFPASRPAGCLRHEIGSCLAPCTGTCARRDYQTQVRAARAFLDGIDIEPLAVVERDMHAAASIEAFERAALLRDKWRALSWLCHRLQRLREAREKLTFVYPQSSWWYLIHGGRAIRMVTAPRDPTSAREAMATLRAVYFDSSRGLLVDSYEHADGLMLVSAWFRKFPRELKRTFAPAEAVARCQKFI